MNLMLKRQEALAVRRKMKRMAKKAAAIGGMTKPD